jgi:hypothetical protein
MTSPTFPLAELAPVVSDAVFVGVSVAFFAFAAAYGWFCKKVR